MNNIIFCNGNFLDRNTNCVNAFDRGLIYGDGLFETMLSFDKKLAMYNHHWQRLTYGLNILNLHINNYSKNRVLQIINKLFKLNNINNKQWVGIKLIVSRGAGPRSILPITDYKYTPSVIIELFDVKAPAIANKSLYIMPNSINQHDPINEIKSLNYLSKIIYQQQAKQNNYDDALLINTNGNICEATTSNIFFITTNNEIITPKISDGILPGVTRKLVIKIIKMLNIAITEQSINYNKISNIKSAFTTNSISLINSITKINNVNFNEFELLKVVFDKLATEYN